MRAFPSQKPSRRYTAIFKDYYEKKSQEQIRYLDDMAELFLFPESALENKKGRWAKAWDYVSSKPKVRDYFSSDSIGAYACPFHLVNISKAYFIDIIRYKEYHYNPEEENIPYEEYAKAIHGGEKPRRLDADKRAAFLIKWILKTQPIQVELSKDADLDSYDNQNQVWYVNEHFSLFVLWQTIGVKEKKVPEKEQLALLHQFRYRPYDENIFSLTFKKIQEAYG
ncbi:MAG: hypothetical protein ACK5LJ_10930 [Paracoccus sp. (in: a-proteobacteria)]